MADTSSADASPADLEGVDTSGAEQLSNLEPASAEAIVVGFDASSSSREALTRAVELAGDLGRPLTIVCAWTIDSLPRGTLWKDGTVSSYEEISRTIRQRAEAESADVLAAHSGVPVEFRAVLGHPAEVLIAISAKAYMLVLGSRGRGGFAGMLLGSVSDNCVRHAACPVLVVR